MWHVPSLRGCKSYTRPRESSGFLHPLPLSTDAALELMQIYYPEEEEAGQGQWWNGSVAADMLDPEEAAAASADPWAVEGLWERYVVHWAEPPVRNSPRHHHITP